jgi:hypothetical protein
VSSGEHAAHQQRTSVVDADGAIVMGRLRVGPKVLGYGSAGVSLFV